MSHILHLHWRLTSHLIIDIEPVWSKLNHYFIMTLKGRKQRLKTILIGVDRYMHRVFVIKDRWLHNAAVPIVACVLKCTHRVRSLLVPIHCVPAYTVHDDVSCMYMMGKKQTRERAAPPRESAYITVVFVNYQVQFRLLKWVAESELLTPNQIMEHISNKRLVNFCLRKNHNIYLFI